AGAIVDDLHRPTELLAARRSAPKSLAGQWEFAGGKVEPGEAPEVALHRELREELGVGVLLGAEIPSAAGQEWPILHGHTMRIWFVQIVDGAPEPLADHDELRWLPATDLYQVRSEERRVGKEGRERGGERRVRLGRECSNGT